MTSSYTGPKKIVVLGGGVAGVAAFDALTAALAAAPSLPPGMSVTLVEADDEVGGRAQSWPLDGPSARHPHAPYGTNGPHGIHFVWGSYAHVERLMGDLFTTRLSLGSATYCAWMAPPDLVGDDTSPARIAAIHVCDPSNPSSAWNARAERVLRAFQDASPVVRVFESFVWTVLGIRLSASELLSYMDLLFDEDNLGPELRWILLFSRAVIAELGTPETNPLLSDLLGGKSPADCDIGDLVHPLFFQHILPKMTTLKRLFWPLRLMSAGVWPSAAPERPTSPMGEARAFDDLRAISDLAGLIVRDTAKMTARIAAYDPRKSGFLKNALKAAFSNPYPLDVGTVMRDAQFGLRDYQGAILRLFDGDDSRGMWRAIAERAAARLPGVATIKRSSVARRLVMKDGAVTGVELAVSREARPPDVPALRPLKAVGDAGTLAADAVVSTLLPRGLLALLEPGTDPAFVADLTDLGTRMNETLNLQLFWPRKVRLPVVGPPTGGLRPPSSEVWPASVSNLEGPFTIVVDLERAWSKGKFEAIALSPADTGKPFAGSAWELVGTYPECFTFDPYANPGRVQWPVPVQEKLIAITNDPNDFDPAALDARPWVHDTGTPGHPAQPMLGEIKTEKAGGYQEKWTRVASPIIAGQTMRMLAQMPGLAEDDARYLAQQADAVERGQPTEMRWTLLRACQAENRFFSAEPGLFARRPYARFPTPIGGLWVAGDWTRNGLNLQAMEGATISGLQAASGVLEHIATGGVSGITLPFIDPSILPDGAWDSGRDV